MHHQITKTNWIASEMAKARINERIMSAAEGLMPFYLKETSGDRAQAAVMAYLASEALIDVFVKKELI